MKLKNFFDYLLIRAEGFLTQGKKNSYRNTLATRANLISFCGKETLSPGKIDLKFVQAYSAWLRDSGLKPSTQSFYLRAFRSAVNQAVADRLLPPLDDIFKGTNTRVLFESSRYSDDFDADTIRRLESLDLSQEPSLAEARDMFLFAFYCRGMELADLLNITRENVKGNYLEFQHRSNGQTQRVPLPKQATDIIDRYAAPDRTYIFLPSYMTPDDLALIRNRMRYRIATLGRRIDAPNLTFSSNVVIWKKLFETTPFIPM